ncbi:GrpB family protein [Myroides fluvii]|uniref:GrpB family protein n=1 Tax=Myroides fluvii TaxID=2572594 RepID=UPI001E65A8EC|nr:GrpB family protein [Myroides fluvii]
MFYLFLLGTQLDERNDLNSRSTIGPFENEYPQGKEQFETIKSGLALCLQEFNPLIGHMGSTAVKGWAAKLNLNIKVGIHNEGE